MTSKSTKTKKSSKRHEVVIVTGRPGRSWASCLTCRVCSKQGDKKSAETWMSRHISETSGA